MGIIAFAVSISINPRDPKYAQRQMLPFIILC